MPRTIHVTVTYSVHIENDSMTDKQARIYAENIPFKDWKIFETKSVVHEKWDNTKSKPKKGIGSY